MALPLRALAVLTLALVAVASPWSRAVYAAQSTSPAQKFALVIGNDSY